MSRVLVFDIELADSPTAPGKSWGGALRGECGMSIAAVYDSSTRRPYLYTGPQVNALADHLELGDAVVGFNSIRFDVPVIEALTGRSLDIKNHIDLLKAITGGGRKKGYRLTDLGERCLGRGKEGDGALAPSLYQEGRWPELISYLLGDVFLTRDLLNYISLNGGVLSPDGAHIPVEVPVTDII